ncbi:MAG: hypothetical protein AAF921_20370 [Cyanobacteria bacterium P01_D01_bin.44]
MRKTLRFIPLLIILIILILVVWVIFSTGLTNYFNEKSKDIVASLMASFAFALILASSSFVFYQIFSRKLQVFWLRFIRSLSGQEFYSIKTNNSALNEVTKSLTETRLVFIRIGEFNLTTPQYDKVVRDIIEDERFWDYHIHLKVDIRFNSNFHFLKNFFEFKNNQIKSVKLIDTVELSQIQQHEFIEKVGQTLKSYNIPEDFSDVIIQGVIVATQYPSLSNLDLQKLNITKVTFFYNNKAHELDELIQQAVSEAMITTIKQMSRLKLFIGKKNDEEKRRFARDQKALEIGKKFMKR